MSASKIVKPAGQEPTDFERQVAQALFDLEATHPELGAELRDLHLVGAREVDVSPTRRAVLLQVPFRLLKPFHRVQTRLVRELEKKFSGRDVVVVAQRRILPRPGNAVKHRRPRSRTLTAVQDAVLEDLVFPTEIVARRVRYGRDGSRVLRCILDARERNQTEFKLETFSGVYRKLTGRDVRFEYPSGDAN